MEQRMLLEQEDLFLLDFSDKFFNEIFKERDDLEKEVDDMVKCVNAHPNFEKGNIWHCIFDTVIKKVCPDGLGKTLYITRYRDVIKKYPILLELLSSFYADPFFLSLDIAQEIQYNLLRLEPLEEIDLNKDEQKLEGYEKWIDIGIKKYGKEKKLGEDFEEDMDRLNKKYGEDNILSVKMFCQLENHKIPIVSEFIELNLAYMGNERFRDYLYHIGKRGTYLETLMDLMKKLNEMDIPMYYIWEKLTNFNVICILGKFFFHINRNIYRNDITQKEQMEFLEAFIKGRQSPFCIVKDMPNYLTRLLCLKQVLSYIEKQNPNIIIELWNKFNMYLEETNFKYKTVQKRVLALSILVKWKLDEKKNRSMEQWIESLDREYPMSLYETLYVSSNIPSNLYLTKNIDTLKNRQHLFRQEKYRLVMNEFFLKNKFIIWPSNTETVELLLELNKNLNYMEVIEKEGYRPLTGGKKWGKRLKEAGYIPLDKVLYDNLHQKEQEDQKTPVGEIFYPAEMSLLTSIKEFQEKFYGDKIVQRLEQIVCPHLLSQYNYISFENIAELEKNKTLKKYINLLLYYFYI